MLSKYKTRLTVATVLPLLAIVASCATKPIAPTLAPNQFRMETVSRTELNNNQGGTLRVLLPRNRAAGTVYKLRDSNSDNSGMLPPPSAKQTESLTVQVVPVWKNGDVETTAAVSFEQNESLSSGFLVKHTETHSMKSKTSIDFGHKQFVWMTKDGVYPFGKPVVLGTVDNKPVTFTIGKP